MKYVCKICGYVYDPEKGDENQNIPPGVQFNELPDSWVCPECGAGKEEFEPF
ncbi:MAG: rubredoxin [Candidatus Omnitrophica bacterium]|nr:rubredoxin [Candidatus Omnitrophota bacterium]